MLSGFCFGLLRSSYNWYKCHMYIEAVFSPCFKSELPDCLKKRNPLDISYCPSNFNDNKIRIIVPFYNSDPSFDFISNVGNNLNSSAEIIPPSFFLDNLAVYLPGCDAIQPRQRLRSEPFIISKIQVGLSAVIGYVNFTMLIGAHCAGVYINIWVHFHYTYLKPPALQ